MNKPLNISLLLDICGIIYTEEQIIKLQKLLEDLLQNKNLDITKDICEDFEDSKDLFYGTTEVKIKTEEIRNPNEFSCEKCEKKFATIKLLSQHVQSKHEELAKVSKKCDKCQKKFKSERALQTHRKNIKNCESTVPNLCQHCGKVFETADQLR